MTDSLYELLAPHLNGTLSATSWVQSRTVKYLERLSTLSLESLNSTEPQILAQSSHSNLLAIQSLSKKSSKAVIASADHLSNLRSSLPTIAIDVGKLQNDILTLDKEAIEFSKKYSRSQDNDVLDRRKKALLLSKDVERLSDVLDLPTLLASTISSSNMQGTNGSTNYTSALDLHSHIKRVHLLYQDSTLVSSVHMQAEQAMREMTTNLISSLRAQGIKLAAAMRTISWLKRISPELDAGSDRGGVKNGEAGLGALFLVCRLSSLVSTLEALEPLRGLADQETQKLRRDRDNAANGSAWSEGQQTERYLKRYIEIFREQSFAIVSMFKSIFPFDGNNTEDLKPSFKSYTLKTAPTPKANRDEYFQPIPSAIATFPLHLLQLLAGMLKKYLPNVRDKSARESLLTQVLYCAGSLGRLGGDFSIALALLEEDENMSEEWVEVIKKHRVLAGRLETLASTVGVSGKGGATLPGKMSERVSDAG
ncbi:hypothetical protein MMC09_000412 [Bachmanniomyces sp. S44760]|nr:hypothetical protein [Bachmanniomyces sp. S44760]